MNMKLILLEFKMLVRGFAFPTAMVTLALLLLFAAFHQRAVVSAEENRVQETMDQAGKKKAESTSLLVQVENGEKSFKSLWDDPRGYYTWHEIQTHYPSTPFNVLATGQRDLYAPVNAVSIYRPPATAGRDIANPVPRLFGSFDPTFVLVYLLPLFIIAFGNGIISRESQSGALSLLLAQGSRPEVIPVLKVLPRYVVVTGSAIVFTLGSLAMIRTPLMENLSKTIVLIALIAAYSLFWFLVALAVNLIFRRPGVNAMAMATLWAVITILLPTGVSTLSEQLFPMPSRIRMVNAMRTAGKDADQRAQEIMAQYYHDHPELDRSVVTPDQAEKRFFDFYRKSLSVGLEAEGGVKPIQDLFAEQGRRQRALENTVSYLSPTAGMSACLEELAGTSGSQYRGYAEALSAFGAEWRTWFQQKAFAGELISRDDLDKFPAFTYDPANASTGIPIRFSALILINVVLGGFVYFRVRGRAAYRLLD